MARKIQDIMTKELICAAPNEDLIAASRKMRDFDIGTLPVRDKNQIIGFLTDRDMVIRAMAEGLNPKDAPVRSVMTSDVISISEDEDIYAAAQLMEENQVRRLVVCDNQSNPVGILSQGDIATRCHDEYLTAEIVSKVSKPV